MTRKPMMLVLGVILIGVGCAIAYVLTRSPPAREMDAAAARGKPSSPVPTDGVPMQGRTAISPRQSADALASGLIDRPIKSLLKVDAPMHYGEFVWNDRGVPAGPAWVRVDLRSQLLSVFRSGHEIGTSVLLYGADGLPTPTGKFPILAKLKDHVSATYGNAPMPTRYASPTTASRFMGATCAGVSRRTDALASQRSSPPSCSTCWKRETRCSSSVRPSGRRPS